MAVKYNIDSEDRNKHLATRGSYFTLPISYYTGAKPLPIPVTFSGLKSNTKYKVFLNNFTNNTYEDITEFCEPYGVSRSLNEYRKPWLYFVSDPSGRLLLEIQPFGTENVDPALKDWNEHWKRTAESSLTDETQRNDFFVVEYSKVLNSETIEKSKNLTIAPTHTTTFSVDTQNNDYRYIRQLFPSNLIQTFFVDPNLAQGARTIDVEKVTLYFRDVPEAKNNASGIEYPAVYVALIDVEDGKPIITKQYRDSVVSLDLSNIEPSGDAENGTDFVFHDPVRLDTGKTYGIAVLVEDEGYELWYAKKGDVLVGTTTPSSGSSKGFRGDLFLLTTERPELITGFHNDLYSMKNDTDIKFDLSVCQYEPAANITFELVNRDYEFLTIDSRIGFYGGEYVYKETVAETGEIYVAAGGTVMYGNNTVFDNLIQDEPVLLIDSANNDHREIVHPLTISSNNQVLLSQPASKTITGTYSRVPTGVVEHFDTRSSQLYLHSSTANASRHFSNGDTIRGLASDLTANIISVDTHGISSMIPDYFMDVSNDYKITMKANFTYDDNGTYRISDETTYQRDIGFDVTHFKKYKPLVLSKSLEATNPTNLYDSNGDGVGDKSARISLTFEYVGDNAISYEAPEVDASRLFHLTQFWSINNDSSNEDTNHGNALAKHISNPLTFAEGVRAEDVRLIYNAYLPPGTSFKSYAKILHSNDDESLEDKYWTELDFIVGEGQVSNPEDENDVKEFEVGFPHVPKSATTITGTVSTEQNSPIVVGKNTQFLTELSVGDIIKVYDPLFADRNFEVYAVQKIISNTQLQLSAPIIEFGVVGSTIKIDTLENPYTAFNNPNNLNIVRYFDRSGQPHDTYDTIAIKTVLLSNNRNSIPYINDYRVIGVSA